jgi:hypothetical protein
MNAKALVGVTANLTLVLLCSACAVAQQDAGPAQRVQGMQADGGETVAKAVLPPQSPDVPPILGADDQRAYASEDISLDPLGSSPVQDLANALELLARARAQNSELLKTIADQETLLDEKDRTIAELRNQLSSVSEKVQTLEKDLASWQTEVLGYRKEVRDLLEAQTQVIEKVLALLEDLKKQEPDKKEPTG